MHDATALKKPVQNALYDNAKLFGGRVRITAFGRFYNGTDREEDWTVSNLRKPGDEEKDSSLSRNLPTIARELKVNEILAPAPVDFNARVCWQRDLTVRIPLNNRVVVRRGTNADGCRLNPGQAYLMSSAGCPTIIAYYPKDPKQGDKIKVDVAHAGLRSLIDEQEALTRLPSRKPESVVESMLHSMNCTGKKAYRLKRVGAVIAFPIPPTELSYLWDHPRHGENNEAICEYIRSKWGEGCVPGNNGRGSSGAREGKIDLAQIITRQFGEFGIPPENIGLILTSDAFWKTAGPDGHEVWYSTRGKFPTRRNLTIVTRYT